MKTKIISFFLFILTATAYSQEQFAIYFQSNSHHLTQEQKNLLEKWILQNSKSKILSLAGHTDEDGSNTYNDSLAQKRITTIYQILHPKIAIHTDFKKINFGETAQQSKIKSQNRKVVLYYLQEKDLKKENEILSKLKTYKPQPKPILYFPSSIEIGNPDGTTTILPLDVPFMETLNNATVGSKLKINHLNFILNTFAITKESRSKLYELLLVMQLNPKLKIEIQGHVCCVKSDLQNLSTQRARAIYKFLEMKNINKDRMSYKGFGSSQPLYPLPEKTEEERAQNRRVEIQILANEP